MAFDLESFSKLLMFARDMRKATEGENGKGSQTHFNVE